METQEDPKIEARAEAPQMVTTLTQNPVEQKPQDGDCVGHCAHVSEGQPVWYRCENTTFADPVRNISGSIDWLCICTACEALLKEDPKSKVLSGLGSLRREPQLHLVPLEALREANG